VVELNIGSWEDGELISAPSWQIRSQFFSSSLDSLARKEKQLKEIFSKSNFAEQSQERRSLFRPPGTLPNGALSDMGTTTGWGADPPPPTSGQFIKTMSYLLVEVSPSRRLGAC
jgi:hypothetical protein